MIDWLMRDEQKTLFEILVALAVNMLFLALSALALWPLDKLTLTWSLAKGYGLFWLVMYISSVIAKTLARIFRLSADSHFDAYLMLNLSISGFVVAGWSAFVALAFHNALADTPSWIAVILFIVGFIASYVSSVIIGSIYQGSFYRLVNALLSVLSFVVFAIWPTLGRVIYGWFFDLF
jgi:hypothetical protein